MEVPGYVDEADTSRFTVRLKPGTYYLVETQAGENSQLLPGAWPFTVQATGGQEGELGDLEFQLNDFSRYGGLVEVSAPDVQDATGTEPWIIKVANIAKGEMPHTGSVGVWWLLGFALLALVAGIAGQLRGRREA